MKRFNQLALVVAIVVFGIASAAPVLGAYPNTATCDNAQYTLWRDNPPQQGQRYDNLISGNTCDLRDADLTSTDQGGLNRNDWASVITVWDLKSTYRAQFCEHANYVGNCLVRQGPIQQDNPSTVNLGAFDLNDKVSSYFTSSTQTPTFEVMAGMKLVRTLKNGWQLWRTVRVKIGGSTNQAFTR